MKLAILSRNGKLYSTRRLVEAARLRGHSVRVLDPLRCYMRIGKDGFALRYRAQSLAGYGAVIPRIGASINRYGNAVLHQFELMGCHSPNPSAAIMAARDKLRCHQLLAAQAGEQGIDRALADESQPPVLELMDHLVAVGRLVADDREQAHVEHSLEELRIPCCASYHATYGSKPCSVFNRVRVQLLEELVTPVRLVGLADR